MSFVPINANMFIKKLKSVFNIFEIIFYSWWGFCLNIIILLYTAKFAVFIVDKVTRPFFEKLPNLLDYKFHFGFFSFICDLNTPIVIFFISMLISIGRKNKSFLYSISVIIGYYIFSEWSFILAQKITHISLITILFKGDLFLVTFIVSILIFLLCIFTSWLGNKIGGKILQKYYLVLIGIATMFLGIILEIMVFKNILYGAVSNEGLLFIISGSLIMLKSTDWFLSTQETPMATPQTNPSQWNTEATRKAKDKDNGEQPTTYMTGKEM